MNPVRNVVRKTLLTGKKNIKRNISNGMKIKKDDNVIVTAGKDRGRKGKVIRALPAAGKVVVEGMNVRKKHVRPRRAGQKGQIVEMPSPFDVSNVQMVCPKCGKATRVGYAIQEKTKTRVCKKCGAEL